MPKEVIVVDTTGAVEVKWGRETEVQIATTNLDDIERGWFLDLNRDQINKLVRILRKARDQAFGVDE